MKIGLHRSAKHLRARESRLEKLKTRVQQQLKDADCLLEAIDDYCREHPDDCSCAANDPNWREQIVRQRDGLSAMLQAVNEKLRAPRAQVN
jgi:hypothetical protein